MLHETRIHFQHRIVKTQFSFCRVAAQFNDALQRTAAGRRGCNRRVSWPPSLSLGPSTNR